MTLPQRATAGATPNFAAGLDEARAFFTEQDEASAAERFRALRAELREMVETLRWAPAGGRPARFLGGQSVQARIRARKVEALAHEVGLPHLREYVLEQHVVLYAHSSDRVVLLALRHHRQLSYMV